MLLLPKTELNFLIQKILLQNVNAHLRFDTVNRRILMMMRSEFLTEKKNNGYIVGCHVVSIPVPKSREDDMDSKVICIHHAVGAGNDFQMDTCH